MGNPNQSTKSNNDRLIPNVQSNPIPKEIQKRTFNCFVQTFTILKSSPIPLSKWTKNILILFLDNYLNTSIKFLRNKIKKTMNQNKNEIECKETELELRIRLKCL